MTALGWEVGEAVPCHTGGNLRTRSLPAPQSRARGTAASRHTLLSGNLPPEPAHAATGDSPPPGEQHGRPEPTSVPHVRPPRWPPHSGSQGRRRTGPRALPSSPARPQGWRHQAWGVPSPRPPPPGPGRAAPRRLGRQPVCPSCLLSVQKPALSSTFRGQTPQRHRVTPRSGCPAAPEPCDADLRTRPLGPELTVALGGRTCTVAGSRGRPVPRGPGAGPARLALPEPTGTAEGRARLPSGVHGGPNGGAHRGPPPPSPSYLPRATPRPLRSPGPAGLSQAPKGLRVAAGTIESLSPRGPRETQCPK